MRLITLLACLVVAASTLPAQADVDQRVPYGPHGPIEPPRETPHHWWYRLATPTPTRFGTEYIVVGRDIGPYRTLRIEAVEGTVYVRQIEVTSGRLTKIFLVRAWLDPRHHPIAYVDLGRDWYIDRLAVTTSRRPAGMYVVDGSPAPFHRAPPVVSQR